MNSTVTSYMTESPIIFPRNIPQSLSAQSPAAAATTQGLSDSLRLCRHQPLSCMTTPKCVLGVLSSGALGGTEMTGGLEGFLLGEVLFSERGRRKAGGKKNISTATRGHTSNISFVKICLRLHKDLCFKLHTRTCFKQNGCIKPANFLVYGRPLKLFVGIWVLCIYLVTCNGCKGLYIFIDFVEA